MSLLSALALSAQVPTKITGEMHKLALFPDGTVGGWGDMRDGQLGPRAEIPNASGHAKAYVPITLPAKARDIAAGNRNSYFLMEDGTVMALGWGLYGQLGCGEACLKGSETPVKVTGLRNVASIEACGSLAYAVHQDGALSAWGQGANGLYGGRAKGDGPPISSEPLPVLGVAGIKQISCGGALVLALTNDGRVYSWGVLHVNKVFSDEPQRLPALVPGLDNVAQVVATGVAAVLKKDGTVWVWGNNQQAQFGNGKRDDQNFSESPVRVPNVANAVALTGALVGRHFLALLKDGTLRVWGNTDWGQAGVGISGMEQASVATPRISGVKTVFAAGNNSYAVKADGSLWIWGSGSYYSGEWPMKANAKVPLRFSIPQGLVQP
ncbi:MAG: hypothetical protein HY821_25780 [Acidobacteria bacterium]|nr:hypothetical protein [Acidobacteriota bacterium]